MLCQIQDYPYPCLKPYLNSPSYLSWVSQNATPVPFSPALLWQCIWMGCSPTFRSREQTSFSKTLFRGILQDKSWELLCLTCQVLIVNDSFYLELGLLMCTLFSFSFSLSLEDILLLLIEAGRCFGMLMLLDLSLSLDFSIFYSKIELALNFILGFLMLPSSSFFFLENSFLGVEDLYGMLMFQDSLRATESRDWLLYPEANFDDPLLGRQTGMLSVSMIFLKSFRKNLVLLLLSDFLYPLTFTLLRSKYSISLSSTSLGSVLYLMIILDSSSISNFGEGSTGWYLLVLKSSSSSIITSRIPFSFSSSFYRTSLSSSSSTMDISLLLVSFLKGFQLSLGSLLSVVGVKRERFLLIYRISSFNLLITSSFSFSLRSLDLRWSEISSFSSSTSCFIYWLSFCCLSNSPFTFSTSSFGLLFKLGFISFSTSATCTAILSILNFMSLTNSLTSSFPMKQFFSIQTSSNSSITFISVCPPTAIFFLIQYEISLKDMVPVSVIIYLFIINIQLTIIKVFGGECWGE